MRRGERRHAQRGERSEMVLDLRPHTSHWGAFDAVVENGAVVGVRPFARDADPSPILENIPGSLRHQTRIAQPMIRAGWLDRGPGPDERRGAEPFVPVSWETAIDLLSGELRRVYDTYGSAGVYGGSYGWASAGRFHHAQSQLHRFLNCLGGYVRSVNTYSHAAGEVILPRIVGTFRGLLTHATAWSVIAEHANLIVAFGGIPLKNTAVSPGGISRHTARDRIRAAKERGVEFVLFSPLRDDLPEFTDAEWHALRPGTDVAVMLGLAYTLLTEGLHDKEFLARYCVGFDRFERYLLGDEDGQAKTAEWAEAISGIPTEAIRALARRMASGRALINVNWSLQRTDHGEQAPWMGLVLAAMLGQVGLPGGGFGFGYGSMGYMGEAPLRAGVPSLPQRKNLEPAYIPVSHVSDMLLRPGESFDYDGEQLRYPDVKLVYWCGGNPFHHHQDLGRLRRALARPETIVVHDPFWTGMARHADIVIPATMSLERNDLAGATNDHYLVAMHQAVEPNQQARNDYDTFSDLAEKLGVSQRFTEGRSEMEWLRHLYECWRSPLEEMGQTLPSFEEFWQMGYLELEFTEDDIVCLEAFRHDPEGAPLRTPSGKIEIFSEAIDSFGYDDCPGHPAWLEPVEWLGAAKAATFPLQLIANNPRTRLHSQLDVGAFSQSSKIQGREPIRIHPDDAAMRGIEDGDVVRVFNDRGSCLAGALLSRDVRAGVVQLSTGAWYDPLDPADPGSMCVHGNPNVLTLDKGTSRLGQGNIGQHALVQVERWEGELPPVTVGEPPSFEVRAGV
ncbi:MAG: biotin/methionine sulfoxide reductase [Thermomicrobiales bacterium]|nr:biotin/methionine sulfoxide reductase [Thermomicrobiales bacterium]